MAELPLPEDPTLRQVAEQLEARRYVAEVWDARWQLAYLTDDYVLAAGAGSGLAQTGLGEPVFSQATLELRDAWPAGATTGSFIESLVELASTLAYDLPGGAAELRAGRRRHSPRAWRIWWTQVSAGLECGLRSPCSVA